MIATIGNQAYRHSKRLAAFKASKHDGIINLINVNNTFSKCSAFVVSDELAITASHCVKTTTQDIKNIMEEIPKIKAKIKQLKRTRLLNLMHAFHMSRILREMERRLANLYTLKSSFYIVQNKKGQDTGIRAIGLKRFTNRDIALVKGNFKDFHKIPYISRSFGIKVGQYYKACGYAAGNVPYVCVDFKAVGSSFFLYAGESFFAPGMSGGPLLNNYGQAVGVISRVGPDFTYIAPILGIF